jgi:hypothetical protein
MIEELVQSGTVALLIIAVMAAEALYFARYFKRFPAFLSGLAAGACMALALYCALAQQGWKSIAALLLLSGLFHATEIWSWLRLARRS